MIWALAWCFLVVLLAMQLRLEIEIGAFLAGLALAQLPFNDDLRRRIHPLMNFFIAVFFVTLGIEMELSEAAAEWKASIGLSLFVLIGNPLIFMIIIAAMKYGERTAFNTSVTVAQISEFSFIFVAMGVTAGLIGSSIMSITALVGIITISISAYLILYSEPIYRFVRRTGILKIFKAKQEGDDEKTKHISFHNHIIVVGMNALGRMIVRRLHEKRETVLAVDTDIEKLHGLPGYHVLGNVEFEEVVEEIGLAHS